MRFDYSIHVFLPLISLMILTALTTYSILKARKTSVFYSYISMLSLYYIWFFGTFISFISKSGKQNPIHTHTGLFTILVGASAFLIFAIVYTDMPRQKFWIIAISLFTVIKYVLALFKYKYSHTFFADVFEILSVSSMYVLVIFAIIILVKSTLGKSFLAKRQVFLLILCVFLPVFTHILCQTIPVPEKYRQIVFTLSMVMSVLGMACTTIGHKLLDIIPIAEHKIVENMSDAVLVVDNNQKIIGVNEAFRTIFGFSPDTDGKTLLSDFICHLSKLAIHNINYEKTMGILINSYSCEKNTEVLISNPENRFFNISIQPLLSTTSEVVGRTILFTDISQYKALIEEINAKNIKLVGMNDDLVSLNEELTAMNQELIDTNDKLKEHSAVVEELAATKERNRIAGDIHDTLGHTLTVLVSILEVCNITVDKNIIEAKNKMSEGLCLAREGLNEIRHSISGIRKGSEQKENLIETLEALIEHFQSTGTLIHLLVDCEEIYLSPSYIEAIYRVCQEALTNSLKHGKATEVNIMIKTTSDSIKLYIFDNGCGCEKIDTSKGFGLDGMKNRIESLNGKIVFGSHIKTGFNIRAEIPFGKPSPPGR